MFYIIYKITNKLDGKFYIGSHKTKKLDDDYMGSGKYLKLAILKYGIENFTKEILYVFDTPEEMYKKEAEIVNEEFLITENTYNLKIGGFGGFDYINSTNKNIYGKNGENGKKRFWTGDKVKQKLIEENRFQSYCEKISSSQKSLYDNGLRTSCFTTNNPMKTEDGKRKQKKALMLINHQQGEKNSQFGTTWIWCKEEGNKKIKKELLQEYLDKGWEKKYNPGYKPNKIL